MRRQHHLSRAPVTATVIAMVVALGACGGTGAGADRPAAGSGAAATAALHDAPTLAGTPFDAAAVDGRPAVAWFWAPWCVICRSEGPDVADAAVRYAGEVSFVGVAGRGEIAAMHDFVADTGTGRLQHVVDDDGAIWDAFGVFAQPAFAFVDTDGTVEVFVGSLGSAALIERIDALIA